MKRALLATLLLSSCLLSFAQQDYKSRGMNFVSQANYGEAITQFEAAKAVLSTQKINQNDPKFIDIEKKISYAQKCIQLAREVNTILGQLNESSVSDAFLECSSESEADQKMNALLSTVGSGKNAAQKILQMFPSDRVNKENLSKFAEIENLIERNRTGFSEILDWKTVMENRSVASYQSFLSNHPSGIYAKAARDSILSLQDHTRWAEVLNAPSEAAFRSYLETFKNGQHRDQAKTRLDALVSKRQDDEAWSNAINNGTLAAFNAYISEHPDGHHLSDAKATVANLLEKEDMAAWEEANRINTVSAYQQYQKRFPNGKHVVEAKQGSQRVDDKKLWDEVCVANTIESYERYLSQSKIKLFNEEAKKRVSDLRAKKQREEEEALWAQTREFDTINAYSTYKSSSSLKNHVAEADAYIALLKARDLGNLEEKPEDVIALFDTAAKVVTLSESDRILYRTAVEKKDFLAFKSRPTIDSGKAFLQKHEHGTYSNDVSDAVAKMLADKMDMNVTEREKDTALMYAISRPTRNYVEDAYRKRTNEKKKNERQLKREPFHTMLGIGMETQFTSLDILSSQLQSDHRAFNTGLRGVLSLGGHSNRLNLELGVSYYKYMPIISQDDLDLEKMFRFTVSPRLNIVKKHYGGIVVPNGNRPDDQYSLFYLYLAPEFAYNYQSESMWPYPSTMSYGVKVGMGLSVFDLYVGYHLDMNSTDPNDMIWENTFNMGRQYFSFGVMLYLSSK